MRIRLRSRSPATKLISAALACAALAACSGNPRRSIPAEDPSGYQLKQEPHLQVTEYRQDVQFLPGSATVAPGSEQALRNFFSGIGSGDRVYVVAGAPDRSGLAARRSRAVATLLASRRIQSEARLADEELLPADAVAVVAKRTVVALPECPNWSQPPNQGYENQPMSNWSCATAVNFGMMLADPNDLVRGRDPGPADGEAVARSVENYRKGRTKDIIRDAASSEMFPAAAPSNSGK
jgi:pilus assembly protein CpaD